MKGLVFISIIILNMNSFAFSANAVFESALRPDLKYRGFANNILKKYDLSGCSEIEVTDVCTRYNAIPSTNKQKWQVNVMIRLHFYKFFNNVVFNATRNREVGLMLLKPNSSFRSKAID